MLADVITVPSFADGDDGVEHFFGTRRSALNVMPGRPSPIRSRRQPAGATVMLSVKQVHGTDALVVDSLSVRACPSTAGGTRW